MTRSSTAENNLYFPNYKNQNKIANFCLTTAVVAVIVLFIAAVIIITAKQETVEDLIVKVIKGADGGGENVAIEDREIFEGFRTSFLPPKEVMLARQLSGRYREVDKLSSYDKDYDGQNEDYAQRFKRMAQFTFASEYNDSPAANSGGDEDYNDDSLYETDIENDNEESKPDGKSNAFKAPEKSEALPETHHLEKGPLDDVVEQVRGQPELEEAEIGSPAVLYKPTKSASTFHAFWKGQGDRWTIRKTQADNMQKYMDPRVDPCEDFYQYACGNWAELNPIPADKAGYDTFEMLRENLDSVLRDILEFKKHDLNTVYPGPHLDNQFSKVDTVKRNKNGETLTMSDLKTVLVPEVETDKEKFGIINRIRRYLDKKFKPKTAPETKAYEGNFTYVVRKHGIMPIGTKQNKYLQKTAHLKRKSRTKYIRDIGKMRNIFKKRKLLSISKNRYYKNKRETKKIKRFNYLGTQTDPAEESAVLKARYLFKSCMNHEILQKRGQQPLLDLIKELGGWPILDRFWVEERFDWVDLMAKLRLYNNDILISEWVGPDIKNSDEFVIQFDQTTLGLPTRDYFLMDSNKVYLEGYKNYLIIIAVLLGGDHFHVMKSAEDLITFEKKLARITSSPEERRNVSDIYRRMPLGDLELIIPEVKWKRYLTIVMNREVDSNETVVIFALNYVKHLVKLIEETPPNILRNYLLWRFVRHRVNNLDDRFQSAKQQFYHILFGREQAPPRWKNCVAQVNSNMGMALGALFVQKYFDEMSKNDTLTMTKELQQSFIELLHLTDWIDDETKSLAERKVNSMILRIGYPDYILDENELNSRYQEVLIHPNMYFENILNILQHLTKLEQARLGHPVDKSLWNSAPAVVNAYYSRNKNQIMFPAGILQPPFYHRHFPRSLNYGGIGVVIGHEITHGFDDKGRLFDSEGNLHRWWSDSAIRAFHKRAQCLIDQYGEYVVPEVSFKLDGVNTQGENIADNGGVKQAFRAYLNWLHKHGDDGETLPGLNHTHTQLFFLNFAQVWCGAIRPEAMRSKMKTAVHSPGRFRVIGSLSNSEDFAREFDCPLGSPMNPKEKCSVW